MGEIFDALLDMVGDFCDVATDNMTFVTKFQQRMRTKFDSDLASKKAIVQNIASKETLVKQYIRELSTLVFNANRSYTQDSDGRMVLAISYIQSNIGDSLNQYLTFAHYDLLKNHFVKYWRQALDISRVYIDDIEEIFDDEIIDSNQAKLRVPLYSIFLTNQKAIFADDLLDAVYEVLSEF